MTKPGVRTSSRRCRVSVDRGTVMAVRVPRAVAIGIVLVVLAGVTCRGGLVEPSGTAAAPAVVGGRQGIAMTLTAAATGVESRMFTFAAEIVGGPDNNPDLYCVASTWGLGDGPPLTVTPSCTPWTPDVAIPRRFEVSHTYADPGSYEATFAYGPLTASVVVEVP